MYKYGPPRFPNFINSSRNNVYRKSDNVTDDIQRHINSKQNNIVGSASTIVNVNLTADRVLVTNSSQKVVESNITTIKLDYLADVTSSIQSQLDGKENSITKQNPIADIDKTSPTLSELAEKINDILAVLRTTGIINKK